MSHQPTEPLLDEASRRDLALYWDVHRRVEETVRQRVFDELREDPILRPIVDAAAEDTGSRRQQRALLERAMTEGEWTPYLERLQETGRTYARMGVEFAQWFRVVHGFRQQIVPHLVEAYDGDDDELAAAVRGKGLLYDLTLRTIGEAYLRTREETIAKQQAAISELSTPVLRILPGLLLMPIVGVIDTGRSRQLTESLLHRIRDDRARVVVLDITGVPEVDSEVANRLIQAAEATRLMGAVPLLTGLSPGVAQTLVGLGVDLKGLQTLGDLERGIQRAQELLGVRVVTQDGDRVGDGWV